MKPKRSLMLVEDAVKHGQDSIGRIVKVKMAPTKRRRRRMKTRVKTRVKTRTTRNVSNVERSGHMVTHAMKSRLIRLRNKTQEQMNLLKMAMRH